MDKRAVVDHSSVSVPAHVYFQTTFGAWVAQSDEQASFTSESVGQPRSQGFHMRTRRARESPGLGRSILHSDWLTPYCLKITELDS